MEEVRTLTPLKFNQKNQYVIQHLQIGQSKPHKIRYPPQNIHIQKTQASETSTIARINLLSFVFQPGRGDEPVNEVENQTITRRSDPRIISPRGQRITRD